MVRGLGVDDAEANAYVVDVLNRLRAVEATDIIAEAFEQGKVDTGIMDSYDVDFMED